MNNILELPRICDWCGYENSPLDFTCKKCKNDRNVSSSLKNMEKKLLQVQPEEQDSPYFIDGSTSFRSPVNFVWI